MLLPGQESNGAEVQIAWRHRKGRWTTGLDEVSTDTYSPLGGRREIGTEAVTPSVADVRQWRVVLVFHLRDVSTFKWQGTVRAG